MMIMGQDALWIVDISQELIQLRASIHQLAGMK